MSNDELPFTGLEVLDLSQGVAGPHCGMLLAQNGADVVKVEPPAGDWGRAIGRQYGDYCAYYVAFNRGKRSLAVDLKTEAGLGAVKRLAKRADVIVENYRPSVLARFGLDYDAVRADNRDVVYVSITGFGQTGPRAGHPATDSILQAYAGLMSVNRDGDGMPQRIGVLVIDVVTGLYAFQGAATALYRRATRGGGKHVRVSLMESIGAVQAGKMIEFHLEGESGKKPGVPVASFLTADGHMTINARRDGHFASLCKLLGCEELALDPRFATAAARLDHEAELMPPLRAKIETWETEALAGALTEHDILHAPVNDYASYFADPHVRETEVVRWLEHPGMGTVPFHGIPGLAPPAEGDRLARSPALGEHSTQVLAEIGMAQSEIESAISSGAVRVAATAP